MQVSKAAQPSGSLTTPSFPPLHVFVTLVVPLGFVAALLLLKVVAKGPYAALIAEDGFFEYLTFFLYLIASGLALAASLTLRRKGERLFGALYLVLALACFYIAGEEISWGQRIFDIQSMGVFATGNRQGETNTHNFLHRYVLHGIFIVFSAAFAFAWYIVPQIISRLPQSMRNFLGPRAWLLTPDRRLMLYFLPCMLLYIYYDYVNPIQVLLWGPEWHINKGNQELFFIISKDQESIEALLAAGVMVFIVTILLQARRLGQRKA